MSRLADLFDRPGVSAKYREHSVGYGFPVAGYHDVPPEQRAPLPLLGKGEKMQVQLTVRVRQFDLSKPDDLAAYTELRDKIGNRLYRQVDRKVWTNPDTGDVKVFMEWAEPQYLKPKGDPSSTPQPAPPDPSTAPVTPF